MQSEAIQLLKDFTTEHAKDEVEFHMDMVTEEDQSFEDQSFEGHRPSL